LARSSSSVSFAFGDMTIMNVQAQAPAVARKHFVVRRVVSTLICLLILTNIMTTLGDNGWEDTLRIAVVVIPWILVFLCAGRWRVAEQIGWVMLVVLFILRLFA
jgi:hypothetical protein